MHTAYASPVRTAAPYPVLAAAPQLRYAIASCALGQVLIAATERGLCAVTLGDSAAQLVEQLQQHFPSAAVIADPDGLAAEMRAVLAQIHTPARRAELPLDICATKFQQRVWQALRQIPCGTTVSYAQLAATLGQPKAVRAVARACAQNPVAILTPCHRVIGSNGSLTGYRWGLERKMHLLQLEAN